MVQRQPKRFGAEKAFDLAVKDYNLMKCMTWRIYNFQFSAIDIDYLSVFRDM